MAITNIVPIVASLGLLLSCDSSSPPAVDSQGSDGDPGPTSGGSPTLGSEGSASAGTAGTAAGSSAGNPTEGDSTGGDGSNDDSTSDGGSDDDSTGGEPPDGPTAGPVEWSARFSVGARSTGVIGTGDFNQDGVFDAAYSRSGAFQWYAGPDFADEWTLGEGGGSSYGATSVDIDGDGWNDFIAADGARNEGPGRLWVFHHPAEAAAAQSPWTRLEVYELDVWHQNDLKIADLDGDGRLDIAVRTRADDRRMVVAFQNEDLSSWTTRTWPTGETGNTPEGLGLGDVDGDGEIEIVLSGVYWDAPGGFRDNDPVERVVDEAFVGLAVKSAVADLDHDGEADDIIMSAAEGGEREGLVWYQRTGDPESGSAAWTKRTLMEDETDLHALETGYVNDDEYIDVVVGATFGSSGIRVFYGSEDIESPIEQVVDGAGKLYVTSLADLDGDGDLDLVGPEGFGELVYGYTNEG